MVSLHTSETTGASPFITSSTLVTLKKKNFMKIGSEGLDHAGNDLDDGRSTEKVTGQGKTGKGRTVHGMMMEET